MDLLAPPKKKLGVKPLLDTGIKKMIKIKKDAVSRKTSQTVNSGRQLSISGRNQPGLG